MDNAKDLFLGVDVGSVSTNIVAADEKGCLIEKIYLRTEGQPIKAIQEGMKRLAEALGPDASIKGAGATGSGRQLAACVIGADTVKNEITAHAVATQLMLPEVRTILEIGGQDSKIIFIKNGIVCDFAMNTVCAAGTGSFLDRKAGRLNIPIEKFGLYALQAEAPVRIAGRCAVFAESDMIHKQQLGFNAPEIICGLCEALVRNYLTNLAKGKKIEDPVVFQGGVAANAGIAAAFEKELKTKITIPIHYDVMGAYGAALLAIQKIKESGEPTSFRGFELIHRDYKTRSVQCTDCPNSCELIEIASDGEVMARWGGRCGKWAEASQNYINSGCRKM
ncbi:MAG: acyl-CoA dehydratase activase [Bacillota bacterium]|nr:acyl-CoA dehydratase activase [Bacillota bacterium]